MLAAAKVLRWALVGLYDETLLLLKANIVWFLISLPLGLPLLLILMVLLPLSQDESTAAALPLLPLMLTGLLLLLVPNPASLGVCQLAAIMQRKESPPFREFWRATRENARLGLTLYIIGLTGLLLLGVAVAFYLKAGEAAFQVLSLIYLYLGLFWLLVQLYLGPLAILLAERRLTALYRRSALLVLAHPIYSLTFLFAIALVIVISVIVVPLYPGLAMAFVALIGTRALAELKRKYDPEPDRDEEAV